MFGSFSGLSVAYSVSCYFILILKSSVLITQVISKSKYLAEMKGVPFQMNLVWEYLFS